MKGFGDAIEMRARIVEQTLASRTHPIESLGDATQQADEKIIEHRAVQRFFVAKVVVEQRLVDAGGGCDGVHARPGNAFLGKFDERRLQNCAAAGLGLATSSSPGRR